MAIVKLYSGSTVIAKLAYRTMQIGEWLSNFDDVDFEFDRVHFVTHFSVEVGDWSSGREQLEVPKDAKPISIIRFCAGDLRMEKV